MDLSSLLGLGESSLPGLADLSLLGLGDSSLPGLADLSLGLRESSLPG